MRQVNAKVMECGQPRRAYYMGTHTSKTKHYMEIRYGKFQSRKWVPVNNVQLDDAVKLRYIEKVAELNG